MSEKRFELSEIYSNTIMDTENCVNNGSHCRMYDIEEVVDLLNELSDENNILNKNEDDLKECTIENIKLKEENEKLRQRNRKLYKCALYGKTIGDEL